MRAYVCAPTHPRPAPAPPKVGRGTYRLPTGSAHANGGAAWVKKRFSLAARHRFFGQAPKKWGRTAAGGNENLPTYRRTRTKHNDEAALSCAVTCAPFYQAIDRTGPARSTPFLCSCAKKRGGAPKKRAYGCRHGTCTVPPASPTNSKPQHHRRLRQADLSARSTHQPPPQVGRGTYRLPTGSAHADGGAAKVKKALFFGGSTPFLWASTKEMGSKGSRG